MATVDEILTRQAYADGDESWTKDDNYPSYHLYVEPEYVPVTNKRIADFNDQISVRGEQNAQFVGFQLPRHDDGLDLTAQHLYIHYQTVYGGSDSVPCNVSKSDSHVRMCWQVPAQATQEPGAIQMMIYATGANSAGERVTYKTLPASYTIHDGLEIGGGIPEPDQSWYEQFVAQMEGRVSTAQGYANDAQASKTAAAGSATASAQSATASAKALEDNKAYVESQKETFVGYNKRETDLKYANALIGFASGTTQVTVDDAWEAPIPGLEIAGKSEQVVTTGAQLFDESLVPDFSTDGAQILNNGDGSFTITGSIVTTNKVFQYELTHEETVKLLKPGTIYYSDSNNKNVNPKMFVRFFSGATLIKDIVFGGNYEVTEDNINDKNFRMRYAINAHENLSVVPGIMKPMLYQDGDGTWEPYTGGRPSPSPEYPQEIVSTDVTAVTVTGANQSKAASIILAEPLRGIGDHKDEITMTKRIDRCVELVFDGSENWNAHNTYRGFVVTNALASARRFADGYCNQMHVARRLDDITPNSLFIGLDSRHLSARNNQFYDDTAVDKGLSAWKAHLAAHPLKVVTYLDTPVETDLGADTIAALAELTTYKGRTTITVTAEGPEPDVTLEYVQDTRMVIADLQAQINEIRNGGTT